MAVVAVIYGFAGAKESFRPVHFETLKVGEVSVWNLRDKVNTMHRDYPNIKQFILVDQWHGLATEYYTTCKKNTYERYIEFRDRIARAGMDLAVLVNK